MLQALLHPSQKKYDLLGTIWEEFPQVILLCAISFLLNHEDMILTCTFFGIFPEIAGGLLKPCSTSKRTGAIQPQARRLCDGAAPGAASGGAGGAGGAFSTPAKETAPIPSDDEDAAQLVTRDDNAADFNNSTPPTPGPAKGTHLCYHRHKVCTPPTASSGINQKESYFAAN